MSGSFHISFFTFRQFWQPSYENQLSLSGKDSTADFFGFGHFDQNTKNEKWNELDNCFSQNAALLKNPGAPLANQSAPGFLSRYHRRFLAPA